MIDIPIENKIKPALDLGGVGNVGQQPVQQQNQQFQQPVQQQPVQSGGVVLQKGQRVSLTKINPNLNDISVGLGWDLVNNGGIPYDLDVEAFMLGVNEKVVGDEWFVFYNQPISPDGSVKHMGDNRTGDGHGDDEVIEVNLKGVNNQVAKIVFVVTINDALTKGHNFGGVANAYIRVVDKSTGAELVKFSLTEYYANVTSMVVGELYLKGGEWRFNPVGDGVAEDLAGMCIRYGVNLA